MVVCTCPSTAVHPHLLMAVSVGRDSGLLKQEMLASQRCASEVSGRGSEYTGLLKRLCSKP